jgi:hypothetical protein
VILKKQQQHKKSEGFCALLNKGKHAAANGTVKLITPWLSQGVLMLTCRFCCVHRFFLFQTKKRSMFSSVVRAFSRAQPSAATPPQAESVEGNSVRERPLAERTFGAEASLTQWGLRVAGPRVQNAFVVFIAALFATTPFLKRHRLAFAAKTLRPKWLRSAPFSAQTLC